MAAITVSTTVRAHIETVWKCWNDPSDVMGWCHADDSWHAPYAENDLRVDGKLRTTMAAKDGSMSFDFEGVYTSVEPWKSLAYVMADGRRVSVSFAMEGEETTIVETFDAESEHPEEMQRAGWQAILDNFKAYVEPAPREAL